MRLKYRKEIDGLRALAVIPVILFHADFSLFDGGYIGVDIFFVISGYLISSFIFNEIESNNFSLIGFYERRARRILPALYLVFLVSSIFVLIFLSRSEINEFFNSVISSTLFFSNFFFWYFEPYFSSNAGLKPLIHTWSLSIEEQFYIFFPILFILLIKLRRKQIVFFSFVIIFLLSLFLAESLSKSHASVNFYFTFTRIWEIVLGVIISIYFKYYKYNFSKNTSETLSLIGLLSILYSIFFFSKETPFPSLYALIPTVGTGMIIIFANNNTFTNKILSLKIFVGFGLISYSLYLWHQPLLAFSKNYYGSITLSQKFLIIFISVIISYFSWKYIEKFFRDRSKLSKKSIFYLSSFMALFFILLSSLTGNFFSPKSKGSSEYKLANFIINNEKFYIKNLNHRMFNKYRIYLEQKNPDTLVVGSSRVNTLGEDIFLNKKVLNLFVESATIEDHITMTTMALEKFKPSTIILAAEPWLFNENYSDWRKSSRWKIYKEEYKKSISKIEKSENSIEILDHKFVKKELSLYEKFLENLYAKINVNSNESLEPNKKSQSVLYGKAKWFSEKKEIRPTVINHFIDPYKKSSKKYELYEKFIKYLKNQNIEIILFLTPYENNSYDLTIIKNKLLKNIEEDFIDFVNKNSIKILGSYDPRKAGCLSIEFHDYIHPNTKCTNKIVNR